MKEFKIKLTFVTCMLFFIITDVNSQNAALGIQYTFPSYGISGKYHLNDHHCVQAIFGALGVVSNYSGRYNYIFEEQGRREIKPFLYAQAGIWRYNYDILSIDESVIGYGAGAGLQFNWMDFISERISTTLEIGYGNVNLMYYDFSFTSFGFGIHYNFGY